MRWAGSAVLAAALAGLIGVLAEQAASQGPGRSGGALLPSHRPATKPIGPPCQKGPTAGMRPPSVQELYKAIGEENYAEARRMAELLLQVGSPSDRQSVLAAYGRILLAQGQKAEAQKYLAQMRRQPLDVGSEHTLEVYAAWLELLEGRAEEARRRLEKIFQEQKSVRGAVEAAEVLAQLGWKQGEPGLVERACRAGLEIVRKEKASQSTLPEYLETLLQRRRDTDPDEMFPEAKRAYEEAMRLFREGQWAEGGKRFWQIPSGWPRSS